MPQSDRKAVSRQALLALGMLFLTALLTYAIWFPRLGYYHDDWYMLWSGALRGADSLIPLFSMDRPFMGVIYSVYYRVLGDSIPAWHFAALLWRVVGAAAFYWIITTVWPRIRHLAGLAAVLFLVYPGFLAQPNAATKINHLTGYAAALLSIGLTLSAAKTISRPGRILRTVFALLLMALYLWIYEYMIGLEVMRVLLLLIVVWQGSRKDFWPSARRVIFSYLSYVLVIGIFLFWRVFLFDSTRYATDMSGLARDYIDRPLVMLPRLVFQVIKDFFATTIYAWSVQAYSLMGRAAHGELSTAFALAVGAVLLVLGYVRLARRHENTDASSTAPLALILIGVLITLAAIFPVVLSNRFLNLLDSYKGYGLHPSAGVMILFLGLILLLQPRYQKPALIALIGLAVFTQAMNQQRWAAFWDLQRNAWWQLTWRAPNIADNTLVMVYFPEHYPLQQDYEVWGPVNLIYRPQPPELGYNVPLIQSEVLNADTVLEIYKQATHVPRVRDIIVQRDYRKLLLISQPTLHSCIHIIDGVQPLYSASERPIVEQVEAYSSTSRIDPLAQPPAVPEDIFGQEPARGWCYYYQQANLARQTGDWAQIVQLFDSTAAAGLTAGDASEYFVFIEGLVNSGRIEDAQAVYQERVKDNAALRYGFCQSASTAPAYPDGFGYRQQQIAGVVCVED